MATDFLGTENARISDIKLIGDIVQSGAGAMRAKPDGRVLLKQPRSGLREIGEHEISAGPADGGEALHHGAFAIDPAIADGGHDHRKFAAHLIRAEWNIEALARLVDQVEIRHGG